MLGWTLNRMAGPRNSQRLSSGNAWIPLRATQCWVELSAQFRPAANKPSGTAGYKGSRVNVSLVLWDVQSAQRDCSNNRDYALASVCRPAWDGNWTHDCFIAFGWEKSPTERLIAVVNFSDHQSQAKSHLPFVTSNHEALRFQDLLGNASYDRHSSELATNGLY